jgi:peptide/nickel transport system substrate-binding protein
MPRRAAVTTLAGWMLFLGMMSSGCGGRSGVAGSVYHDPNPLPADTLTMAVEELGVHGGRFVLAQTSSPRTFNPIMANETSSTDITDGRLFTTLVDFNNATQVMTPQLARSWDVSPDGLTWTWHLRRGAAFSDGHPLTAEDVLFTFEMYMDDTLHVSLYDFLKLRGRKFELSAPDSYTVVMRIAEPYAMTVAVVGSVYILPRHVLEPAYRSGRFASTYSVGIAPESLVTSGPWRLKQYVPTEKTVLERTGVASMPKDGGCRTSTNWCS